MAAWPVMDEQLKWYDDEAAGNSPWINALTKLRQRAAREGYCYQHVQAITVAIDQYAEKALGNCDYFSTNRMAPASAAQGAAGFSLAGPSKGDVSCLERSTPACRDASFMFDCRRVLFPS